MDKGLYHRLMRDILNEPFDPNKDYDAELEEGRNSLPEYGHGISEQEWEETRKFLTKVEKERDNIAARFQESDAQATVLSHTVTQLLALTETLKDKLKGVGIEPGVEVEELSTSVDAELAAVLPDAGFKQAKEVAGEVAAMDMQSLKAYCEANTADRKRLLDPDRNPLIEPWEANGRPNPFVGSFDEGTEVKEVHSPKICGHCRADETKDGSALLQCARCKGQKYCSKKCQKKHWKVHKSLCSVLQGMGA